MKSRTLGSLTAAAVLPGLFPALWAPPAVAAQPADVAASKSIAREGAGTRRETLDRMELAPFNRTLWSEMTDWTGGEPLDPTTTDGKVVLIYTWANYLPTSTRPISVVRRLVDRYGDDGLVVVGLHADEGWEDAASAAERRRANFPIARDKGNAVREALHVDQDPDFYVIDRAGQLRFADIDTSAVERAVSMLIEESPDRAAGTLDRIADAEQRAAEEARRSARIRQNVSLDRLPAKVPFPQPAEAEYESADWPKLWKLGEIEKLWDLSNADRERDEPREIPLPDEGEWVPGKPDTEGKITVIYFFSENQRTSFIDMQHGGVQQLFSTMQELQRAHPRDIAVVGAIERSESDNRRRRSDEGDAEQRRLEEKADTIFNAFARLNYLNHAMLNDWQEGALLKAVRGTSGRRSSTDEWPISYVAIVDSSGKLRYHGTLVFDNTRDEFDAALARVLEVDPGVVARRAAEAEYLRKLAE